MAATLQEIAEKTKLSLTTVSYILNNKADDVGISEKTRHIVRQTAKNLGYRSNQVARSLKSQKTGTIGLVFTNARGTFMNEIISGIQSVSHQEGYDLFLCISDDDWKKEAMHIQMLRERRVDGMIVFFVSCRKGEKANHDHLLEVKKDGIPLILIDRYLPGTDIDYVVTDDFAGAYDAVTHLITLGHRRIAHITVLVDCTSVQNRLEGYKKALIDAGIEINKEYIKTVDCGDDKNVKADVYKVIKDFLTMENERPTAIFTVNDGVAMYASKAIKESGLSVPQDIALVGFGNFIESALVEVPLTVVDQPKSELGEKVTEILIQKIEQPELTDVKRIAIKPKLIIRDSCGAGNTR